jgi:hypothetical protein
MKVTTTNPIFAKNLADMGRGGRRENAGGAREGSGRKPENDEPKRMYSGRLAADVHRRVDHAVATGAVDSKSEAFETAIRALYPDPGIPTPENRTQSGN